MYFFFFHLKKKEAGEDVKHVLIFTWPMYSVDKGLVWLHTLHYGFNKMFCGSSIVDKQSATHNVSHRVYFGHPVLNFEMVLPCFICHS